ncbi:MAG TPA: hypothetical protein VGH79_10745 [Gaiellaceae bacterium]
MASVTQDDERGVNWLVFASTMLGLAGIMSVIDGIVALSRSKFYAPYATYVFSDLRTWGWIMIVVGVLLVVAAMGVVAGSQFGRWFGIGAAVLSALAQFSAMQAYPGWTMLIFAVDVLVIYALAAYGGKPSRA